MGPDGQIAAPFASIASRGASTQISLSQPFESIFFICLTLLRFNVESHTLTYLLWQDGHLLQYIGVSSGMSPIISCGGE
jgi:hypothetical protein